jgi:DNA-binding NarL/FixJ family response regulator
MNNQTASTINVVLIDDHRSVIWGLEKLIDSQKPKMQVVGKFTSFAEASIHLEKLRIDIILLDLDLGNEQGIEIIPKLIHLPNTKVIVLTGSRDVSLHDKAIIAGAKGVLEKENPAETILTAIERVHEGQLWIDQARMDRIIFELSQKKSTENNDPERKKIQSLTAKEKAVVIAMTSRAGATGCDVAKEMHISESTLRNHLSSIYTKLGLGNRLELWEYANKYKINKSEAGSTNGAQ